MRVRPDYIAPHWQGRERQRLICAVRLITLLTELSITLNLHVLCLPQSTTGVVAVGSREGHGWRVMKISRHGAKI